MNRWKRRSKWAAGFGVAAAYFALAEWSKHSYVDQVPKGKVVIQLFRPFQMHEHVAISNLRPAERLRSFADDENVENDTQSPVVIYENQKPLGPAHSTYADIRDYGMGRFSFGRHQGFVFTASDNSDPSTNGRTYWAVIPE